MPRFIHTLALAAGLIALMTGLWNDWSLIVVVKRLAVSYLGCFVLASVLALVIKTAALFEVRAGAQFEHGGGATGDAKDSTHTGPQKP